MSSQLLLLPMHPCCTRLTVLLPNSKLGELQRMLAKVELEGQNQSFGEATVHATVLRVQPSRAPQHLTFASQREVGPGQSALVLLAYRALSQPPS